MGHNPTNKQKEAYEKVISAIKEANKAGLVFYGKQENLVAYTKDANNYANQYGFDELFGYGTGNGIPYLGKSVLIDSGADDYPAYKTPEDEEKFINT